MNQAKILFILLVVFTQTLFAQKKEINEFEAIDNKVLQLPNSQTKTTDDISDYIKANFKTDSAKTRAIFFWIATNIKYDIGNMFKINANEKEEEKISKPLKSRKGICENYAALFNELCIKSGVNSYVIEGYTKQNGFADYISHAWCAALIDGTWYLFDPTWGSGYINGGKFHQKINNFYFMAKPSVLIKSHMPFDYLWQFLEYPITNQEFYERKTSQKKSKSYFNYNDSIRVYKNQDTIDQLASSAFRIERNGVMNALIFDKLQQIKMKIENYKKNIYNSAVSDYNDAVNKYNDYINYKNDQFTPKKTDAEIQNMIDAADIKIKDAQSKLAQIKNPDANTANLIIQLTKSIDNVAKNVTEQLNWLKTYFSKGKLGRKAIFVKKTTWFGIPLN
jgi:transglutaminase/protease-like cytokinesis protein 3